MTWALGATPHPHSSAHVEAGDTQVQSPLGAAWDSAMVSLACWLLEDSERPEPRWQPVRACGKLWIPPSRWAPLPWSERWR